MPAAPSKLKKRRALGTLPAREMLTDCFGTLADGVRREHRRRAEACSDLAVVYRAELERLRLENPSSYEIVERQEALQAYEQGQQALCVAANALCNHACEACLDAAPRCVLRVSSVSLCYY
jgi:ribosomal protein S18 acetylase RimI-like enzyme